MTFRLSSLNGITDWNVAKKWLEASVLEPLSRVLTKINGALALGAAVVFIASHASSFLAGRAMQGLIREVYQREAIDAVKGFSAVLGGGYSAVPDVDALREGIVSLERQNPMFHIYIVDRNGIVKVSSMNEEHGDELHTVRSIPIARFVKWQRRSVPIEVSDPREPWQKLPFAAYPLPFLEDQHFVLGVLRKNDALFYHKRHNSWISFDARVKPLRRYSTIALILSGGLLGLQWIVGLLLVPSRIRERRTDATKEDIHSLAHSIVTSAEMLVAKYHSISKVHDEKRTFIASLSHDIKSPLSAVKGYVDVLLQKGDTITESELISNLQIVERNTSAIVSLVDQLVELSHLEEEEHSFQSKTFDLFECLHLVLEQHLPDVNKKQLFVVHDAPESPLLITGCYELIYRACSNIIQNAVKFTPSGGRIAVSESEKDGEVIINVRDTGPGVPESDLPHVFDKFYRCHRPEGRTQGSGLGLFITRRVAEFHGGSVSMANESGGGCSVSLKLPLKGRHCSSSKLD